MQETPQQYIERILGHVEGQDALKVQRTTAGKLKKAIHGLSPKQLKWKPEPAKWSIAEILAHLSDAEIVGSWRMRSALGANGTTIQPFDQDVWASLFQYNDRSAELSLEVFRVLRENNLALLQALPIESWDNYGMHLERGKETIAHIARMFAGHDLNHLQQIERIAAQVAPAKPRAGKAKSKPKSGSKRRKKGGSTKRRK
jgi:DinB family protein